MKIVFAVAFILALVQCAFATGCPAFKKYDTTFMPTNCESFFNCFGSVLFPNFKNISQYFYCENAASSPVLMECESDYVFYFGQQKCSTCEQFIRAPPCEMFEELCPTDVFCLKFDNDETSKTASEGTPRYPSPTPPVVSEYATSKVSTSTPGVPTPPLLSEGTTYGVPAPPSPSTSAPDMPTPVPTPPFIAELPPYEPYKPTI